jgi:hypothetical protein
LFQFYKFLCKIQVIQQAAPAQDAGKVLFPLIPPKCKRPASSHCTWTKEAQADKSWNTAKFNGARDWTICKTTSQLLCKKQSNKT